jgi:hypothetical protein
MINLYTRKDRPMVEKAMLDFHEKQRAGESGGRALIQLWKI